MDNQTLDLLAGLSHELRTPLGAIAGYAELLRLGAHGPMPDTQLEMLSRIVRNQQVAVQILDAVVAYGAASSGALPLHPAGVAVAALLQDAIDACALLAAQRGLRLQQSLVTGGPGVDPLTVRVDAAAAHVVLTAMLRDAIRCAAVIDTIDVSVSCTDDEVQIAVAMAVPQAGPPVSAGDGESLFTPFARGSAQRHVSGEGDALALPQARALARRSGGDVVAVLQPTRRELRLTLPRAAETDPSTG